METMMMLLLFLLGVRLSAFFSGIETAFYRASKLRLNIDSQTGDLLAKKMLAFASHPSSFVATILIGNNLANYVTTFAIGAGAILLFGELSEVAEIGITICISPVIFVFGELLPKTLHFRAPLLMIRRYFAIFRAIHWLLWPLSLPLVMLTQLFQKLGKSNQQPMEKILGRSPLANVIGSGHKEGIVTDRQHDLMHGVFLNANLSLGSLVTPKEVAFGFGAEVSRAKLLDYAQSFGLIEIAVKDKNETREGESDTGNVYHYYRVCELLLDQSSLSDLQRLIPEIPFSVSRLEAFLILQEQGEDIGAVFDGQQLLGIVRRRILADSILQNGSVGSIPISG